MIGSPLPLQSENLLRQVSAEKVQRPPGFYKSAVLDALIVLAAAGVSFLYARFLDGALPWWWVLAGGTLFAFLSLFGALLTRDFWRRFLILILSALALISFFYGLNPVFLGSAAAALLLLMLWGEIGTRQVLSNSLEIKFFLTAKPHLTKLMTALIIGGILLSLPRWDPERSFLSRPAFEAIFSWSIGVANNLYPDFDFNSSMGNLARSIARVQLQENVAFRTLLPPAQEKTVSEAAGQVLAGLEKTFGTTVNPDDTFDVFFYGYLTDSISRWRDTFGNWFLGVWAVIVFFVFKGIASLAYFPLVGLAFFFFQLLLAMNMVYITGESSMHEVIGFS